MQKNSKKWVFLENSMKGDDFYGHKRSITVDDEKSN